MEEHVRGRMQSKWKSTSEGGQYFLENDQQSNTNIITFYLFYTPQIIIGDCYKMFVPDRRKSVSVIVEDI